MFIHDILTLWDVVGSRLGELFVSREQRVLGAGDFFVCVLVVTAQPGGLRRLSVN